MKAEGKNSPADVILTVDIGRLYIYEDMDLLAEINSPILDQIYHSLKVREILGLDFQKDLELLRHLKKELKKMIYLE